MVPVALQLVDALRDEACAVGLLMMVAVVFYGWCQGFLVFGTEARASGGFRKGGERGALKVKAEQGIAKEVIEGCPRAVPVVG